MKNLIVSVSTVVVLFGLVACGGEPGSDESVDQQGDPNTTPASTETKDAKKQVKSSVSIQATDSPLY